jgi:hypothetical protein
VIQIFRPLHWSRRTSAGHTSWPIARLRCQEIKIYRHNLRYKSVIFGFYLGMEQITGKFALCSTCVFKGKIVDLMIASNEGIEINSCKVMEIDHWLVG